ncbi:MAG: hypothetical protein HQ517_13325 [SAR324 cluster bacterium]|nr:hypothetical protein [SAR324 cluster bacterium]
MAETEILLDSNIYFRFALDFHPLLPGNYNIKNDNYTLSVIDNFQRELEESPRLQSKFYWVKQERYVENRLNNMVDITSLSKHDIDTTTSYIKSFSTGSASPVDLRALAIAEILNISIATDDGSMIEIADEIRVDVYTSLNMLELFHGSGKADEDGLLRVIHFWIENNDIPYRGFIDDFEEHFELIVD